jgi:DNA mismatch endonuclease (patch repair protein)
VDADSVQRRTRDAASRGYAIPGAARSRNMAAVRRKDTKPEVAIRSALYAAGYRYRKDFPIRTGGRLIRPDITFTKQRIAVFVDGCFWHGCPTHGQVPATNSSFWASKLAANVERDRLQTDLLGNDGWHVVRVWEHNTLDDSLRQIVRMLRGQRT